ncbi:hypothetical protein E5676_scaffold85G00780 [Cucumis melo var. makuwa]|uniref:Uncharacterized protein n=1 Tax=Cucumis melo var. makuwa TaxID=1194695 RepID=A0A5A7T1M4_CUCMM|nr:hypothetical protein E6C27_scaffold278G00440 [Cucumis melo var. makuwa]TYJ97555.1 hypothetical protein E5676_scaffold85G00780 [Cucumis melo var. makuwa]
MLSSFPMSLSWRREKLIRPTCEMWRRDNAYFPTFVLQTPLPWEHQPSSSLRKKKEKETLNLFPNPSLRRLAPPPRCRCSPPGVVSSQPSLIDHRSSQPFDSRSFASFCRSPSQGKSLAIVFSCTDSSSRQRLFAIHHQSSPAASFCRDRRRSPQLESLHVSSKDRMPFSANQTRPVPSLEPAPAAHVSHACLSRAARLRQPPLPEPLQSLSESPLPIVLGCFLGFTKDQLVPTGSEIARVRERASSGAQAEVRAKASWRMNRSDRGEP